MELCDTEEEDTSDNHYTRPHCCQSLGLSLTLVAEGGRTVSLYSDIFNILGCTAILMDIYLIFK